jgi:hypothetical protein
LTDTPFPETPRIVSLIPGDSGEIIVNSMSVKTGRGLGFTAGNITTGGRGVKSVGGGQRVHLNEPRDLVPDVGERIGEVEKEGMKN